MSSNSTIRLPTVVWIMRAALWLLTYNRGREQTDKEKKFVRVCVCARARVFVCTAMPSMCGV